MKKPITTRLIEAFAAVYDEVEHHYSRVKNKAKLLPYYFEARKAWKTTIFKDLTGTHRSVLALVHGTNLYHLEEFYLATLPKRMPPYKCFRFPSA